MKFGKIAIIAIAIFYQQDARAQFAPQAELSGSTAIHKDSTIIIDWARNCEIKRGWLNKADTALGKVSFGDAFMAIGIADGSVVSLGDGGEGIYYLENPIINGPGFDFAIFENGFRNPTDSGMAYLELAEVSVSNDGLNYFSFGAVCNLDTLTQIAPVGEYMDASKLNNLAGKYIGMYGTPFDLDELNMILSLDLNNIRYVKVKDMVGSIQPEYASRDIFQHIINDPYPTPFPTGGFDLDACAIFHQKYPTTIKNIHDNPVSWLYPNPSRDLFFIDPSLQIVTIKVYNHLGQLILNEAQENMHQLDLSMNPSGLFLVKMLTSENKWLTQLIQKND